MNKILFTGLLLLVCNVMHAQRGLGYKIVGVSDFYALINEKNNEVIIDTRGEGAFENRRIVGAINVGNMEKLKAFCDTIDKDTPLLVYCDVGTKSRYVCKYLVDHDFVKVYNLKGGIVKWANAEYPIEEKKK